MVVKHNLKLVSIPHITRPETWHHVRVRNHTVTVYMHAHHVTIGTKSVSTTSFTALQIFDNIHVVRYINWINLYDLVI